MGKNGNKAYLLAWKKIVRKLTGINNSSKKRGIFYKKHVTK